MPELITEHPGVLRHKLEAAGAECGEEAEPRVLVDCPPERFCSLPEGEVCIYGIEEISDMAVTDIRLVRDAACPPGLLPWSGEPQGAAVWAFTLALALWLGSWSGRARARGEQGKT
ncbi:MAG: hypothetical protein R3234_06925 [Thermoanaerobaculia bacterium]|nr:hypothetical protein [Thermoanaerobaculia bacterium]